MHYKQLLETNHKCVCLFVNRNKRFFCSCSTQQGKWIHAWQSCSNVNKTFIWIHCLPTTVQQHLAHSSRTQAPVREMEAILNLSANKVICASHRADRTFNADLWSVGVTSRQQATLNKNTEFPLSCVKMTNKIGNRIPSLCPWTNSSCNWFVFKSGLFISKDKCILKNGCGITEMLH